MAKKTPAAAPAARRAPSFRQRHAGLLRALLLLVVLGASLAAGGAFAAWTLICRGGACPSAGVLESYTPRQTSKLFAADGRFIAEIGNERRTLATLKDIPPVVREAFLVTEDKRFYDHDGVDWFRVPGAVVRNVRARRWKEGFSTITMQLARNIFTEDLSREKTVLRKLREAKVARDIEREYPKDKILELYLNQIYLGAGAYGVETAAQRYFGKSVREVNLAEAALLAALPKGPSLYDPRRHPERAVQRRNTILELMRREGIVSDADASLAKAYPLELASRRESGENAPYYVEWVRRQLEEKFGRQLYEDGLQVHTTLDPEMQSAAERALQAQLDAIEAGRYGPYRHVTYEQYAARASGGEEGASEPRSPYLQGAFVAVDPRTGAVRALVGGRDYDDSKFNRATQALRQPGSTFKPVVYAAAVQNGRMPSSLVDDAPITVGDWSPKNFDGKFMGPIPMRRGLYLSRNLAAVQVGMELGTQNVIAMARRLGLTTPIPEYPSIYLGAAGVFPIELVGAYGTFATLGMHATPYAITRVENARGEVLWAPEPQRESVLSAEEAFLMVSMMKDVNQRGTAYGAVWGAGFKLPSAGKTGTTDDGADVWYVGYTPDLVAGVWIGMDRPQKVKANAQGGELAAPAWTRFMTEVYRRKPAPPDWPAPGGIVTREVIAGTNVLFAEGCTATTVAKELYVAGTEPFETCVPGQLYGADAVAAAADSAAALPRDEFGTPVPVTPGNAPRPSVPVDDSAGVPWPAEAPRPRRPAPRDSGTGGTGTGATGTGATGTGATGTGSAARPTVPPA
ncbi:MAG TPA: PBP1A family penicillin-binding protein [Gemmatirosa sp.]|nr:PBP1A family penicillin-binding protein [Gemmatirosa sp.]